MIIPLWELLCWTEIVRLFHLPRTDLVLFPFVLTVFSYTTPRHVIFSSMARDCTASRRPGLACWTVKRSATFLSNRQLSAIFLIWYDKKKLWTSLLTREDTSPVRICPVVSVDMMIIQWNVIAIDCPWVILIEQADDYRDDPAVAFRFTWCISTNKCVKVNIGENKRVPAISITSLNWYDSEAS